MRRRSPKSLCSQLKFERQVEDLASENKCLEWITNLKAEKHALGKTFNVHVFLGQITQEKSILWYAEENHVGAFTVLGQPVETGCEKCRVGSSGQIAGHGADPTNHRASREVPCRQDCRPYSRRRDPLFAREPALASFDGEVSPQHLFLEP